MRVNEADGWYPRLAALALATVAALVALVLLVAIPPQTRFLSLLNNAGHAPIFGAIAWLLLQVLETRWRAFLATVALGAAVELIQAAIGRDAAFIDLAMDAAGAACVLSLDAARGATRPRQRAQYLAVTILAALVVIGPLVYSAAAYAQRRAAFPDLLAPGRPFALYFVTASGAAIAIERSTPPGLRITLEQAGNPGLQITEPQPDWRGHRALHLDLVTDNAHDLHLTLRIHDRTHDQRHEDRFNESFTLPANGTRNLVIPLERIADGPTARRLDLAHIAHVGLFENTGRTPVGVQFTITRLALE